MDTGFAKTLQLKNVLSSHRRRFSLERKLGLIT